MFYYILSFIAQIVEGGVIDDKTSGGENNNIQPQKSDSYTEWVVEASPIAKTLLVVIILTIVFILIYKFGFKSNKNKKLDQ